MPWTVYSRREATSAAARALIENPARSDLALAELAAVSFTTIASTRAKLEQLGVIPRVDPADRIARPRPQPPPSPTQLAIAELGPQATPRAIADAANVSLQAAWKAWRKLNPPLADMAAASDSLTVSKMPRQLAELAAAADALAVSVSITCGNCARPFTVSTRQARRRYCTPDCADAAAASRGHRPKHRLADPDHPPPAIRELPAMPEEIRLGGLCVQPDLRPEHRYVWTSDEPEDREIARRYCRACSVRMICHGWSLSLPVTDAAIYAGMSQVQRLKAKREAGRR